MSQKSQYNIGFQPTIINAYNCYWRSTVQYIFIAISTKTVLCKFCRICEYDLDYRFLVFIFVLLCFMVALCQLKPRWERYRIQNHVFFKVCICVFILLRCVCGRLSESIRDLSFLLVSFWMYTLLLSSLHFRAK